MLLTTLKNAFIKKKTIKALKILVLSLGDYLKYFITTLLETKTI